jgi:septation ring formation regulator EzrA
VAGVSEMQEDSQSIIILINTINDNINQRMDELKYSIENLTTKFTVDSKDLHDKFHALKDQINSHGNYLNQYSGRIDSIEVWRAKIHPEITEIITEWASKNDDKKDIRKWILRATVFLFFGLGTSFIIEHLKGILHYLS